MTTPEFRPGRACLVLCACLFNLVMGSRILFAQSPVVFMTADITPGVQSKLMRFNSGVQVYAVDNGLTPAYTGITMLNGEVLVGDFIGSNIQRFSTAGAYLGIFASPGIDPVFLETDSAGNVYTTPDSAFGGAI